MRRASRIPVRVMVPTLVTISPDVSEYVADSGPLPPEISEPVSSSGEPTHKPGIFMPRCILALLIFVSVCKIVPGNTVAPKTSQAAKWLWGRIASVDGYGALSPPKNRRTPAVANDAAARAAALSLGLFQKRSVPLDLRNGCEAAGLECFVIGCRL